MIKKIAVAVKVDVSDDLIEKLSDTLEKARCDVIDEQLDIRSGILFLNENDVELHSIYLNGQFFSGTGRKGIIDGKTVKLNGALQSWLQPLRKKFGANIKVVEGESNPQAKQ